MSHVLGWGAGRRGGIDQYTKFMLHMDGADASTTFTDSSWTPKTWTTVGNAQIDTAIAKFTAAGLFDATGDYITTPDHADFLFDSSDFTAECWFNRAGGDGLNRFLIGQCNGTATSISILLKLDTTNVLLGAASANGTAVTAVTGITAITSTGWHHGRFVRYGNVLKLFLDGVQEGGDVAFSSAVFASTDVMGVGSLGAVTTSTWNGSLDEVKLDIGIARSIANFTPPTGPYF